MEALFSRRIFRQFIKFDIVGVSSTVIDWGSFFILEKMAVYFLLAKAIAFIIAVINSYVWNKIWTFRSTNPKKTQEFAKFILASSIGLGLNTFIFYLSVSKLNLSYIYSLLLATIIVLLWNFLINKLWVFKES